MKFILCYGDSLTAGFCVGGSLFFPYGQTLAAQLNCHVTSVGMSGWAASKMIEFAGQKEVGYSGRALTDGLLVHLRRKEYDVICLMAGTNDLERGVSVHEYSSNMEILVQMCLLGNASAEIALMTVPLTSKAVWQEEQRERHRRFNEQLMRLAQKYGHRVTLVNTCEALPHPGLRTSDKSPIAALWDPDLLHLSPHGSQKLGDFLAHQLVERGILRSQMVN